MSLRPTNLDWLWVGSFPEAIDEAWKQEGVAFETIINVSDSMCGSIKQNGGIHQFWFPVFEVGKWDYSSFYGAKRAIDNLREFKGGRESNTLIHCHAGAYRSPIVAASYLYSIGELKYGKEHEYLRSRWDEFLASPRCPVMLDKFLIKMNEFPKYSICGILQELGAEAVKYNSVWDHKLSHEDALREIASYLGVGGFNSETVDPEKYLEKIKEGIDEHVNNALDIQFRMAHGEI